MLIDTIRLDIVGKGHFVFSTSVSNLADFVVRHYPTSLVDIDDSMVKEALKMFWNKGPPFVLLPLRICFPLLIFITF